MIIVAGWFEVDTADARDELAAALVPLQASTRNEEQGCESYVIAADPVVATRINVYEAWATPEDLEAHFDHPNLRAIADTFARYPRTRRETMKYHVDAVAPVRGDDGRLSARF